MNGKGAAALNIAAALGILTALLGIAVDFLPGSSPGLNLPQMLLIAAGLLCFLAALALRSAVAGGILLNAKKHWKAMLLVTAMTLIALEFVLAAADIPTYFPPPPDDVPQPFYQPAPWWTCDEAGCHYVQAHIAAACESRQMAYDRECIINQQGFHDTQDFTASDNLDERMRILTLGDSFTFGASADIGSSYVETIEANFPQTVVWNAAISATGTEQALASFQTYAPILQPQLAILGFNTNDFTDNLFPMNRFLRLKAAPNRAIQQYRIDRQGNAIQLDPHQLYHYAHGVEPPASEIERLIGAARLATPALKMLDILRGGLFESALTTQAIDLTRGYLRALRDAAQDSTLLILLIPTPADLDTPGLRYQTARQLMRELALPYIDPIHALNANDYMPLPDGHWNTAGHQKIGALLSDCLQVFQISQDLSDCESVNIPSRG